MTQKINGAAYPGIWVEKQVTFVKLTFDADISAMAAAHLTLLGTTQVCSAGTVADSTFGVVESAIVQTLKVLQQKSTVLGISKYDAASKSVDVMLGWAEGWFSDANGLIQGLTPVTNAQAMVTTAGAAGAGYAALGTIVAVDTAYSFSMSFSAFNGTMGPATFANNSLDLLADGATPGSAATPMGAPGYYPSELAAT